MAETNEERLWMLVPSKKNLFVGGFKGTFVEAFEAAKKKATANKSDYEIWEADPDRYRREGGLKKLWAVVPHRQT